MLRRSLTLGACLLSLALMNAPASPQTGARTTARFVPKLEPVAETRLLMEGVAHTNFRGLERLLSQKPADAEAWTFARGQALLIAETANLLMLRPPRNQGEQLWFERATDLRSSAAQLARSLANKDYERSRDGLTALANSCNRCHEAFRTPVRITPFAPPPPVQKTAVLP